MAGYWRRADTTRQVLSADGWLRTGDAARRDDDGYIWIVDRVADRFLSDGRPVYPGDVERVLTGHPAVADVGVADTGSGVTALVVPSSGSAVTEEEILADFPDLTAEDIRACLAFAADRERRLWIIPPT